MEVLETVALIVLSVFVAHLLFDLKWSLHWIDKVYKHNIKCINLEKYGELLSYDVINDYFAFKFWDWRWYGMVDPVALQVLLTDEWQKKTEEK